MRQYRIPQTQRKILEKIVQDYERQGIIVKCQSSFNSPAILVGKKDENGEMKDHRFVVDYRKLNQIMEIQNFPIPLIDDILNSLSGCSYFSLADIKNAFHQIEMADDGSDEYTAFTVGHFQYKWRRMAMGISSSPLTWQRCINTVLKDLLGKGVHVYLDDVIIYAKTKEEHDTILWQVLELLEKHSIIKNIEMQIFRKGVRVPRTFDIQGWIKS